MSTATETVPQHMRALNSANRIRLARSAERRHLAGLRWPGSLAAAAKLIKAPPEHLLTMRVEDLLCACRGLKHESAARKVLVPARISSRRTIGNLTPGERARLLEQIEVAIQRAGDYQAGRKPKR